MRVTEYELFRVPPRWVFLKLTTADGTVGWGEPTLEGHGRTVSAAVEEIIDNYLIGETPMDIERHWQAMYRGRHFRGGPILMSAIAGIDQALWDIKGKQYGAPVYELLGGRARDRIQVYQWIGGDTPAEFAEAAETAVDDGYDAVKLTPVSKVRRLDAPEVVERASERIAAVRAAVGESVDVGVDFRGRVTRSMVRWLGDELDQYGLMFIEEPLLPEHVELLPTLKTHLRTPIASGGRFHSRFQFKRALDRGGLDIVQPDPSHAGGITEVAKIAALAESYNALLSLQCPIGPVAFATCLQLDAALHNATVQAQNLDVHDPEDNDLLSYLRDPTVFEFADGHVRPPDEPGLGIEIDEDRVRREAATQTGWQNPIWYHEDGSIAEW
ncbi:galactonate dehydratase [Halobacteriales archaeon QS_1_68_17]|nr:MAG: galactonate dehydratase [Halobacteriales archaeon QS_1_68_17]